MLDASNVEWGSYEKHNCYREHIEVSMIRVSSWVKWTRSLMVFFLVSIALTFGMLAMPQRASAYTLSSLSTAPTGSQPVHDNKQGGANGQVALDVKAQPLADDLCNALTIIQKPHGFHATIKSYIAIHFLTKFGISIVGPFS